MPTSGESAFTREMSAFAHVMPFLVNTIIKFGIEIDSEGIKVVVLINTLSLFINSRGAFFFKKMLLFS
jgi:hypothetical protein